MIWVISIFVINLAGLIFMSFFGNDKNIESRTEREFEILKNKNSKN